MEGRQHKGLSLILRTPHRTELWLGDFDAATNLTLIRQKRISSVLTVAALLGITYPHQEHIKHKVINAFDLPSSKIGLHFDAAFTFISTELIKGNVIVHCAANNSRSTAIVIAYLIKEGMSFNEAFDLVGIQRTIEDFHHGFLEELRQYQPQAKNKLIIDKPGSHLQLKRIDDRGKNIAKIQENSQGKTRSYSLGPIRNLSDKLFLSIGKENFHHRCRPLQRQQSHLLLTGMPQTSQKKSRQRRIGKQLQNGRLSIRKLSKQFVALRLDRPRMIILDRS